jgi:pilus assembly protein CpaF
MASVINLVVQTARMSDGTRKVIGLSEVLGLKNLDLLTQDIFVFERTGIGDNGRVQGKFHGTGVRPRCLERLRLSGIQVSPRVFEDVVVVQ